MNVSPGLDGLKGACNGCIVFPMVRIHLNCLLSSFVAMELYRRTLCSNSTEEHMASSFLTQRPRAGISELCRRNLRLATSLNHMGLAVVKRVHQCSLLNSYCGLSLHIGRRKRLHSAEAQLVGHNSVTLNSARLNPAKAQVGKAQPGRLNSALAEARCSRTASANTLGHVD